MVSFLYFFMPRDTPHSCGLQMQEMWSQATGTPAPVSLLFSILHGFQATQFWKVVQNISQGSTYGIFCFHVAGPTPRWVITVLLSGQGTHRLFLNDVTILVTQS